MFVCVLFVSIWLSPLAADELGDAIRQAEQAEAESKRMSRNAEEGRLKARQLYEQAKLVKFQVAGEDFATASSRFDRAAGAFQRAAYYLDRFRSTGYESILKEAQSNLREAGSNYNDGVEYADRAAERFNGGIDEYNRQLRDERKRRAEQDRTDAFNLMKSAEEAMKKITSKAGSGAMASCLKSARERAEWAFGEFHSAVENADRPEYYQKKREGGIAYYNQAIEIMKQATETGKCKL